MSKNKKITRKEKTGEIKTSFKKFYFPELGKTIEAENIKEALQKIQ